MTRNLLRAGALACALMASTALCTQPALAQAREHRVLDANGVDLTHGDFVMSITEGSIGSGEAELPLVRTGIAYGALDRLTAIDRPNTSYWESDDTFGYDNLGRRTLAATSFGNQITFGHDALGRLTGEASNWHGSSSAEYDAAGRRTRRVYAAGQGDERYDYLATGEMIAIRGADNGVLATFGYDDMGRRTSLSRVNGTGTSYGYDAAGRLGTLAHNFAGTAHDVTFGYGYNPAGQIVSRSANNDAYSLTGVANQNVTDGHNGLNQVTATGSTQVGHDARGNTTQIGSSSYAYTADNRLLAAAGDGYIHDAVGRLIYDHYVDNFYDPGTGQRTGEKVANGGPVTHVYVLGPGTDEPLMDYAPGSGTLTQLHADERGSIIAQSDGGGNVTAINRYDEYGAPEGGGIAGRFGYTGQAWMPQIGMYDYKARIYNPNTAGGGGRFMQPDPIGYGDGMNGYAYVDADPINFIDPRACSSSRAGTVSMSMEIVEAAQGSAAAVRGWAWGACRGVPRSANTR